MKAIISERHECIKRMLGLRHINDSLSTENDIPLPNVKTHLNTVQERNSTWQALRIRRNLSAWNGVLFGGISKLAPLFFNLPTLRATSFIEVTTFQTATSR